MSDWKSRLLVTSTGAPRPLLANAITALREAPSWFGVLAYDEFSRETVIRAAPPWDIKLAPWSERAWSSYDDLLATEWLQREGIAVNTQTTAQAVEAVAGDRAFHPVVDYLSDLQHDGKSRVTVGYVRVLVPSKPSTTRPWAERCLLPRWRGSSIRVARSTQCRSLKARRGQGNQRR